MSKQEELTTVIRQLRQNVPEINGVMIATSDGLAIANDFPENESARMAAMAAAALGLGIRIADTAGLGEISESMIRGNDGLFLLYSAGETGILALHAPANANLGLIRLEATTAAKTASSALTIS